MSESFDLQAVLGGASLDQALSETIPDDISLDRLIEGAKQLGASAAVTARKHSVEIAFMGRCLHVAQLRRKELKDYGISIGDFEKFIDPTGSLHGSLYKAALWYRLYPNQTPDDYARIGSERLRIASYAAKQPGITQAQRDHFLDVVEKAPTVKAAQEQIERYIGEGVTQSASWTLWGDAQEIETCKTLCRELRGRVEGENRKNPDMGIVHAALCAFMAEEGLEYRGSLDPEVAQSRPVMDGDSIL